MQQLFHFFLAHLPAEHQTLLKRHRYHFFLICLCFCRLGCLVRALFDQAVIFRMTPDPEPQEPIINLNS